MTRIVFWIKQKLRGGYFCDESHHYPKNIIGYVGAFIGIAIMLGGDTDE